MLKNEVKEEEIIYVPLTDDRLFKEALSHHNNREFLIHFLYLTTSIDKSIIKDNFYVQYESILSKSKLNDKSLRGDVVVTFSNYILNLECYSSFDKFSLQKSTSYLMRIFSTQKDRFNKQKNMKKDLDNVIQINLIDDVRMKFSKHGINSYHLINDIDLSDKLLEKMISIKYYRIDKLRDIPYNKLSEEERYIRFLGAKTREERKMLAKGDELLMKMDKWCEDYVNDKQTRKIFGQWAKEIEERKEKVDDFAQGVELGREEGIELGREEGVEIGIERGKEENTIEIARNMLAKTSDINFIAEVTGLSLLEIEKLK